MTGKEMRKRLEKKARELRKLSKEAKRAGEGMQWVLIEDELTWISQRLAAIG